MRARFGGPVCVPAVSSATFRRVEADESRDKAPERAEIERAEDKRTSPETSDKRPDTDEREQATSASTEHRERR